MGKNSIARATIVIHAPNARVWNALVDPAAIQQYWFGTHVVSDWKAGSPIVWNGIWEGKANEIVPAQTPHKFTNNGVQVLRQVDIHTNREFITE